MKHVLLVGAGNMGGALLRGWAANWDVTATYSVVDPIVTAATFAATQTDQTSHINYYAQASDLPADHSPDIAVISVKPDKVCASIRSLAGLLKPGTVLVSVAAGITLESMGEAVPAGTSVVRLMPNIGAMAGYSVSAGYAHPDVPATAKLLVEDLFSSIGQMTWLDSEDDIHLVTAISGSGPAYFFAFCEATIKAAIEQGMKPETAKALVVGTAVAAGRLLFDTPDPEGLRARVTSPNGTTAAGLDALCANGEFSKSIDQAIQAARKRSTELS